MSRDLDPNNTTDNTLDMSVEYTYDEGLLTKLTTTSTEYGFSYGVFNLQQNVTVGDSEQYRWELYKYTYSNDQNYYLTGLDYGNNDSVQYNYDQYGRLISEIYTDHGQTDTDLKDTVSYYYDNDGALVAVHDSDSGITSRQYYDMSGRNVGYSETTENFTHTVGYKYNSDNNLIELTEDINGTERSTTYDYDKDNRTTSITTDGTTVEYTYDAFGRVTQQVTKIKGDEETPDTILLTEYFTYTAPTTATTSGQVATYRTVGGSYDITYSYTYDKNGNIRTVSDGTNTTTYSYDSANQLIREDNQEKGKSYTWTYDNAGNILSFDTHDYTTGQLGAATSSVPYTYSSPIWGDLLMAYNGTAIQYDGSGNPTLIGNADDPYDPDNVYFVWEHGRQLASMTQNETVWNYTYNNAGLRTGRYVENGTSYKYVYNGSQLVQMTKDNQVVTFAYDVAGTPLTMKVYTETEENGTTVTKCDTYYYVTNIQGDVMELVNASGTTVTSYSYTAYGVVTVTGDATIIALNPLTYRGYVYDTETGLYYLQSRYYDPAIGRFINADGLVSTGQGLLGNNMFAYCGNNPVIGYDPCGTCIHRLDFWNDCEACGGETIGDKWDNFTDWCGDTFGAGVVLANSYDCVSSDTLFGGVESGVSTSETIAGDISKPISVYVQIASEWWKITEYKIGVQVNIGDGGVCFATGVGETTASASFGNGYTLEGMYGIDKIGLTLSNGSDFGAHTAEQYTQAYIRTVPTIGVALGLLYASNATIAVLTVAASCMG